MRICLIGYGYWGKILEEKLKKLSDIRFICRSTDNYYSKLNDVDWVFVATPDNTHYEIVKKCLWAVRMYFVKSLLHSITNNRKNYLN